MLQGRTGLRSPLGPPGPHGWRPGTPPTFVPSVRLMLPHGICSPSHQNFSPELQEVPQVIGHQKHLHLMEQVFSRVPRKTDSAGVSLEHQPAALCLTPLPTLPGSSRPTPCTMQAVHASLPPSLPHAPCCFSPCTYHSSSLCSSRL